MKVRFTRSFQPNEIDLPDAVPATRAQDQGNQYALQGGLNFLGQQE
jgi:hypothetical protein